MNKKVLTLCAGLLLAGSATAWGQVVINAGDFAGTGDIYTVQGDGYGTFNRFVRDDASSRTDSKFPAVSPFAIKTAYGAKPISELQNVDGVSDGRYFQFVLGKVLAGTNGEYSPSIQGEKGTEILTMVWVEDDTTEKGHYEIQIENVQNANVPNNRIALDRTLWKVTAHKDPAGTTLYYELQNKGSQMLLQLGIDNLVSDVKGTDDAQEVKLEIVSGQTNWRWAAAEKSAVTSDIETELKVLKNRMSAQYDNNMTLHLARKKKGDVVTLSAIRMNSSVIFNKVITIDGAQFYPISFEGWEANPIILTAAQINAELGNEVLATEDQKTPNQFHFEFGNDVQSGTNVMTQYNFEAVGPTGNAGDISDNDTYNRLPGDTPDGYVRFKVRNSDKYLRVDTTYHDGGVNDEYRLQMAVDKVLYPRDAVLHEDNTIDNKGNLAGLSVTDIYGSGDSTNYVKDVNPDGTKAPYSARAYVQLKRQTNFRPIFYPATQSLRLQAEMIYKADKRNNEPWWMQMAKDAMNKDNSDKRHFDEANGGYLYIAPMAENPSLSTTTNPDSIRGYYPAYAQAITANDNGTYTVAQNIRLMHYRNAWRPVSLPDLDARNGYAAHGAWDWDNNNTVMTTGSWRRGNKLTWNAVGNVLNSTSDAADAADGAWDKDGALQTNDVNVWVKDPAATSSNDGNLAYLSNSRPNRVVVYNSGELDANNSNVYVPLVYAPQYATAHNNLVRISTLTGNHRELTVDLHDATDATLAYNGLNTFITLQSVKTEPDLEEVADIPEGFYYIRNAKKQNSDLVKVDDYRYEDLAATNATFTYWNAYTKEWDRGVAGYASASAIDNNNNEGMDTNIHADDKSNIGNLVYSKDKKVIPSAQWYIKGNGGYYTIINRESGRVWGTSYWWKVRGQDGVYANEATLYDGSGLQQTYRDTIRIESIPAAELTNPHMGYLWLTKEEAVADTVNFNMGMNIADVSFSLVEGEDGVLRLSREEGAKGDYKLERVLLTDKDIASQERIPTADFLYGYAPELENGVDTSKMLTRAKYHIYKDDVSANTGDEETSIVTRKYITLNAGKYQLTPVKVEMNDDDGFTVNTEVDELANTEGVKVRRQFYIKQISTEDPNQFVLVDPYVVHQTRNGNFTKEAYGARLFANQMTTEIQPSSLISDGYSNAYAASIFNVEKKQAYNYADIRPAGVDRDTIAIYSAYTGSDYLLSENANGLLESLDSRLNKNNALFLDTANISRPECPRFLIGLRSKDSVEISNLDHHNVHLFTDADYLINMVDSAENNKDYIYQNQPFNSTKYYRLGFVRARHYADGTLEFLNEENRTYDLTNKTLKNANDLNIATFAFRYANANRDEDALYYIETMYDHNTRGWLKTINHVQVVTNDIQEADRYGIDYEVEGAPTANETIAAEGAVSVVATDGAVIIKGAEGKNVVIATILGKVVANETVNSDNETIAVPAGIAVVSVDGESFKVVVK